MARVVPEVLRSPSVDTDMERLLNIKNILTRWSQAASAPELDEEEPRRSTQPDAPMTVVLRFSTESGPRTMIATGIPLKIASDIAREMTRAGHFADYIDECPRLSVADRVKRKKTERASQSKARTVIKLCDRAATL